MRIGVALGTRGTSCWPIRDLTAQFARAVDCQLDSAWLAQGLGADALTMLGAIGPSLNRIEAGTAVIPAQTRHPLVLAQQALTVSALSGSFSLGLGLGHRELLGPQFGLDGQRRVDWFREYLSVLSSLLAGDDLDFQGEHFHVRAQVALPVSSKPRILLAALGPKMLELAGEMAEGTIVWRTGPHSLANHVVPAIEGAAARHQRPAPRILVGLPFVRTDDVEAARAFIDSAESFSFGLPSYREAYAREGVSRASDIALVGQAPEIRERLAILEAAGATDLIAVLHDVGDLAGTWELLAELAAEHRSSR